MCVKMHSKIHQNLYYFYLFVFNKNLGYYFLKFFIMTSIKTVFIALFLIIYLLAGAQYERGFLTIKNFSSKDYKALPQNWDILQDKRGVIYFANNQGLLEYKNHQWKLFMVSNATNIYCLDIDERGYIFVGATNDFGYFAPDSLNKGTLHYVSLEPLVPASEKPFYDIRNLVTIGKETYFVSKNRVFFWNRKQLITIDPGHKITGIFKINNKAYLSLDSVGLMLINDGKIEKIINSEILLETVSQSPRIRSICKYDKNSYLAFVGQDSLKLLSIVNKKLIISDFNIQFSKMLPDFKASKILKIGENAFALGSQYGGVLIFNSKGELVRLINKNNGLKNDQVHNMYLDDDRNLWLALDMGLSLVKISSAANIFYEESSGYNGTIECINRFNKTIYVGTASGLFKLEKNINPISYSSKNENSGEFDFSSFSQVNSSLFIKKKIWDILPITLGLNQMMLVATDDSIVQLGTDGKTSKIMAAWSFCFFNDLTDPNRVYIGLDPGLISIYFENGKWIVEEKIEKVDFAVRKITQDKEGNLWLGGVGVVGFLKKPVYTNHKLQNLSLSKLDSKNGLPLNDAFYVQNINNQIIVASGGGLLVFNSKSKKFEAFKDFGSNFYNPDIYIHRINSDYIGNIWAVTHSEDKEYVILKKLTQKSDKSYSEKKILVRNGELIHALYHDTDGITWFGGTIDGLYRYDNKSEIDFKSPFRMFINRVMSENDTVFEGVYYDDFGNIVAKQTARFTPTVEYEHNTFTFNFSAIPYNFESPLTYSYRLDGYEDENVWSIWSDKIEERYTNLPEGDYVFRVKAKDIYGNISDEAQFIFHIKPPWYRTIWSYLGYLLILFLFVRGAITISTRGLRKIIKAATAEIQAQKDELEEKNKNIMDSIRYAKRIQEAVIPADNQMAKIFPEHFVLFRPRDIVSGDFYWMMNKDGKALIAAADCTGHGVPGAFMSIMGISFLNEIANKKEVQTAAEALNQLRYSVITSLNQEGSESEAKDGMDISLCVFDFPNMKMQFAGAYNSLYMVRQGVIETIKADRMPIGIHERDKEKFTNNDIDIRKGDQFYIMSDGYVDQFGGNDGKKFMAKRFKDLLLDIYTKPMNEQKEIFERELIKWRGDIEQVDDVLIIGIKVI